MTIPPASLLRWAPALLVVLLLHGFHIPRAHALASNNPTNTGVLPLILTGKQLPALLGVSPGKLSAFRCEGGTTTPVVFQVDEVNAGRIVPNDPTAAIGRDATPGVIDKDDEIVFMLKDLGGPCPEEQLARAKGKLLTIKAERPALKEPAFLYVLVSDRGFLPSQTYVRYDPATHTVKTGGYTIGYDPARPFMLQELIMPDLQGQSAEDVFDRLKVRMQVKAIGSLLTLNFTEEDLESVLAGARTGPLRVTRELDVTLRPVPGFVIPVKVRLVHYERLFHAEIAFTVPKAAALTLSSMNIDIGFDYKDLRGVRISTSGLPQGALVDGKMIAQETSFPLGEDRWFSVNGRGLNHVAVLEFEKGLNLTPTAVFADGLDQRMPPEEFPGGLPWVGYGLLGWQDLTARSYSFTADIVILPAFPEGGAVGFVRVNREENRVTVTERQES